MSGSGLAVEGLGLRVAPGRIVALAGPPGSGTSRVLAAIAGLGVSPVGAVLVDGRPPNPREVGFMGRPVRLFPELTAAENVSMPLLARNLPVDRGMVESALESVLLGAATWHNLVEQLSGGQQQRVAVARALVTRSPLVCLDEPVTELDQRSSDAVWAALRGAAVAGAIVVVATADRDLRARCDVVAEVA